MNADLQAFWQRTLRELASVDPALELAPAPWPEWSFGDVTMQSVALSSFGGLRLRGWYILPPPRIRRGRHGGLPLPGVLMVPGYGGVNTNPSPVHVATSGYAVLLLHPRAHGESRAAWDLPAGTTKLTYGLPDPDAYFYRGCYMDCVRGVDFLSARPEVDPERIGVWGASQGGGLTLATAALDHRVQAAVAHLPLLCSFPVAVEGKVGPYAELRAYLAEHPEQRAPVMAALTFFDNLNLADEIACPTMMTIGLRDEVCPPATIAPVFERIRALKSLTVYPELGHGETLENYRQGFAWLEQYL